MDYTFLEQYFCCALCKRKFCFEDSRNEKVILYPVVLGCGHSLCQICVESCSRATPKAICSQCNFVIPADLTVCNFCPNSYVTGFTEVPQILSNETNSSSSPKMNEKQLIVTVLMRKSSVVEHVPCLNCNFSAVRFCETCKCNFCCIFWCAMHATEPDFKSQTHIKKPIIDGGGLSLKDCDKSETIRNAEKRLETMKEPVQGRDDILNGCGTSKYEIYINLQRVISIKFSRLHELLYLEEKKHLQKLQEAFECRKNCLCKLPDELVSNIKDSSFLLSKFGEHVRKPREKQPSHLISETSRDDPKIDFGDGIEDLLRVYCALDSFSPHGPSHPKNNYEENLQGGIAPFEKSKTIPLDLTTPTIVRATKRNLMKNGNSVMNDFKTSNLDYFKQNKIYSISLTHVRGPDDFYVTLTSQLVKRKSMEKAICEFTLEPPQTVIEGQIYLVKYKFNSNWYRVKVIEKGPIYVTVINLDYGDTHRVAASRLKCIPAALLSQLPMAVKCKIFNCRPKGEEWNPQSKAIMKQIAKWTGTVFVEKIRKDYLEVDLRNIHPVNELEKQIGSMRVLLNSFEGGQSAGKGREVSTVLDSYPSQILPQSGEILDVVVTHVNSPSNFYVQTTQANAVALCNLTKDLQNHYDRFTEKGVIYNPKIGMACVALFSADKQWYRAKIVGIPTKKHLQVFYIDYGNEEIVEWKMARKLQEQFQSLAPLAFNCSLSRSGSLGTDSSEWLDKANAHLKSSLHCGVHRIEISKIMYTPDPKLLVHLYTKSKMQNYFTEDIENGVNAIDECPTIGFNEEYKPAEEDVVNVEQTQVKSGKLEVRNDTCAILKNHRIQENVEDLFRPKIHILSVESPSHIYVTFPDLLVGMVKLHKELNSFYKNSLPLEGDKKWTAGERCVIYSYLENTWCRAVVLEVLSSDQVKVFLVDTAKIVTESFSNLRLLNESFQKYPPCAIKCHMSDVYPVGDSWPATSCEFLISEIDSFNEIYITKRGEIKQGSLPVELWVQGQTRTWENNDSTGQLTNKQINWISLNRLMVNEGLALPLTRNTILSCLMLGENLSASPSRSERTELKVNNKNVKVESSCSSLISRNQWLPPMPLKRSSFIGVPTYVGAETEIYLYDVEEDGDKLKHIKEKLSHKYDDSEPDISNFWVAGDMCIAKYHGDNSWYRGTILKVNENQSYNVHFIDYGNTEICTASELRKELELTEIPILTHKFYLPKNKSLSEMTTWPTSTIDFLHYSIVDKKCLINVMEYSADPNKPSIASMHIIEGNVDVSLYLQKNGILGFELA